MSKLRLIDDHKYYLEGHRYQIPSVSGLIKMIYPFGGEQWAARKMVQGICDVFDDIAALPPTSREDAMFTAGWVKRMEAADFGKAVHHYAAQLWGGQEIQVPDPYLTYVEHIAAWWDTNKCRMVAAETMCWADDDEWKGGPVAGTLDMLVEHPDMGLGVLDIKTWMPQYSGKTEPAKWAFQLTAYADMDWIVMGDEDVRFPVTRWWGILHVGPGGLKLHTVTPQGRQAALAQIHMARELKAMRKPKMVEAGDDE